MVCIHFQSTMRFHSRRYSLLFSVHPYAHILFSTVQDQQILCPSSNLATPILWPEAITSCNLKMKENATQRRLTSSAIVSDDLWFTKTLDASSKSVRWSFLDFFSVHSTLFHDLYFLADPNGSALPKASLYGYQTNSLTEPSAQD